MKLVFTAVVAIAFGAGSTLFAQDMIEYSNAASKPPVGLQGLSSKINSAMEKTASGSEKTGAKPGVQEVKTPNTADAPRQADSPRRLRSVRRQAYRVEPLYADGQQFGITGRHCAALNSTERDQCEGNRSGEPKARHKPEDSH